MNHYFYFVDYMHGAQLIAVICSGVGLVLSVYKGLIFSDPVYMTSFALTVGTTIYAIRYALGAVRLMQDLVWNRALFDRLPAPDSNVRVRRGG